MEDGIPLSVFITYARSDRDQVLPIAESLRRSGVPVWLDVWNIPLGAQWPLEINRGIRGAGVLLVICTRQSLTSPNVQTEVTMAWELGCRNYLPLVLDDGDYPGDFPDELRYVLSGRQYFRVREADSRDWLPMVLRALERGGIQVDWNTTTPSLALPGEPESLSEPLVPSGLVEELGGLVVIDG